METGIKIGNDPGTVGAVAEGIALLLQVGAETHSDRETIGAALRAFTSSTAVSNVSISGCTLSSNDPHTHYALETEPLDEDDA